MEHMCVCVCVRASVCVQGGVGVEWEGVVCFEGLGQLNF